MERLKGRGGDSKEDIVIWFVVLYHDRVWIEKGLVILINVMVSLNERMFYYFNDRKNNSMWIHN
jgi:hypothetical protein